MNRVIVIPLAVIPANKIHEVIEAAEKRLSYRIDGIVEAWLRRGVEALASAPELGYIEVADARDNWD